MPVGRSSLTGVTLVQTNYVPQPDFSHVTSGLGPGVWSGQVRGGVGASATALVVTNNSNVFVLTGQ